MNGSNRFRYSVGPVTVVKTPSTCGRGCTYNYFFFRRIELLDTGKPAKEAPIENFIMTQVVDFDAWSVVHELGHAWDDNFSNWLSAQLETQTGGYTDPQHKNPKGCESFQPGCNNAGYFYGGTPPKGADAGFNRLEDFAESVAAYVFPTYAQNAVSKYSADPKYKNLFYTEYTQTERWQYINNLVNGK